MEHRGRRRALCPDTLPNVPSEGPPHGLPGSRHPHALTHSLQFPFGTSSVSRPPDQVTLLPGAMRFLHPLPPAGPGAAGTSQDVELLPAQDVTNYFLNEPPCFQGN